MRALIATSVGTVMLAACASVPPPKAEMARAEFAVKQAEVAGAASEAPLQFRNAQQELAQAQDLLKKKDHTGAQRLAEQAQADAEYAQALTNSRKWQKAALELKATQEALKQELDRSGSAGGG